MESEAKHTIDWIIDPKKKKFKCNCNELLFPQKRSVSAFAIGSVAPKFLTSLAQKRKMILPVRPRILFSVLPKRTEGPFSAWPKYTKNRR